MAKVLRILSVAALLVVLLAGCGGGAPQGSTERGVPRALAREWESRASLSRRELYVLRDGWLVRTISVGIGAPDSPTPTGHFAIAENVTTDADRSTWDSGADLAMIAP